MNLDNREYYASIIDQYKDLAYSIAYKITKNVEDSEEIVQDSFVKAFQNLNKFRNDSQFSTWFYRIVYNTAISATRKPRIKTTWIDNQLINTAESVNLIEITRNLNDSDRDRIIKYAMDKLNELDYTILTLFYHENKSLREIGKIVDKDRNYLKVLLQRARRKLLNELNDSVLLELRQLL